MPKVSVIMPVYNSERTLIDSLSSLVNQTLTDIELILVNDYSTDNSLKILADCEAQFSDKVLLINLNENHGAGGARNIGLSYASGDYIGFMEMLLQNHVDVKDKNVAVLGTGGASKAICEALQQLHANITLVSRNQKESVITYDTLYENEKQLPN